jgi:hypothetical protein
MSDADELGDFQVVMQVDDDGTPNPFWDANDDDAVEFGEGGAGRGGAAVRGRVLGVRSTTFACKVDLQFIDALEGGMT